MYAETCCLNIDCEVNRNGKDMMGLKLRILILVVLILILAGMVMQVKRKKLDLKYTLAWFALVIAVIVLVCFPYLLDIIADCLGIYEPMNMIFFCGFCFSLVIIYTLTVAVSKMADNIRSLTQKIALLEKEGEDNHE